MVAIVGLVAAIFLLLLCSEYAPAPQTYMNPVPGGQPEVDPGSMGQMDVSYGAYAGGGYGSASDTFEEEQPLLKELGVDLELIKQKVEVV